MNCQSRFGVVRTSVAAIGSGDGRHLVDRIYTLVVGSPSPPGVPSLPRNRSPTASCVDTPACLFLKADEDSGSWISSVRFVVR